MPMLPRHCEARSGLDHHLMALTGGLDCFHHASLVAGFGPPRKSKIGYAECKHFDDAKRVNDAKRQKSPAVPSQKNTES